MNGNCHFIFGASVGTALAMNMDKLEISFTHINNSPETATLFILGGLIGGVFPDIDNPKSHIGQLTVPVSSVIGTFSEIAGKIGSNHRGILHDPVVYLLGLVLSYLFCPSLVGLFIGCLSHLYLDMFNPAGIPFFIIFKHFRLGKIKSGSQASVVFTWLNVFVAILLGIIL